MLSGLQAEFALITSYLGSCQYKDFKKKIYSCECFTVSGFAYISEM